MNTTSEIDLPFIHQRISKKVGENADLFESSVISVYLKKNNSREKPLQIGTAFFINYLNNQYLITAQHVIQQASLDGFPVFLSKCGKYFRLSEIKAHDGYEVSNAVLDFYIFKTIKNPGGMRGVDIVWQNNELNKKICLTIGYPNSKNKTRIDVDNKNAKSTSLRLMLSNVKSSGEIIDNLSNTPYFFMWWEKMALNDEWENIDSIGIRGMSGAPCFNIPFSQKDIFEEVPAHEGVKLIGVLVEMRKEKIKFLKFSNLIGYLPVS